MNLNRVIRTTQLPYLKKYLSEEDFKYYSNIFETNQTGLDTIDQKVYPRMFGYKDVHDYYHKVSMDRYCQNIAVPAFFFGAIDDQLICHQLIPFDKIQAPSSNMFLASSKCGAHANHLSGSFLRPSNWYPKPCMEFLSFMEAKLTQKTASDVAKSD